MSFPNDFTLRRARFAQVIREQIEGNRRAYALIENGKLPTLMLQEPSRILGETFLILRKSLESNLEQNAKRAQLAATPQDLLRVEADVVALVNTIQVFYLLEATVRAQKMLTRAIRTIASDNKRRIADVYRELAEKPELTNEEKELLNIIKTVFGEKLREAFKQSGGKGNGIR